MNEVYYIGSYKCENDKTRVCSQACINKMNYIIELLRLNNYCIKIISTAESKIQESFFRKEENIKLNEYISINQIPSIKSKKHEDKIYKLMIILWLILKLIQLPNKSKIILYHGLEYIIPISFILKIKKFKIILELEEIYSKMPHCKYPEKKEIKFIKKFQNIIYVSDILKKEINIDGFSIYGNYNILDKKDRKSSKALNQNINLLYAGSIDEIRGVFPALETMAYLPNNYKLYISGTGEDKDIIKLKESIKVINQKKGETVCTYLGNLPEIEYLKLLQNSDIALNTQIDGIYSSYLFPSKIINYLRLGLPIVTTPGKSIIDSPFKSVLHISKSYDAKDIADCIQRVKKFNNIEGINILKKLHCNLVKSIENILNN